MMKSIHHRRRRGHSNMTNNNNSNNILMMIINNKKILMTLSLLAFGSICIYSNFALVQKYTSDNNNNNNNNNSWSHAGDDYPSSIAATTSTPGSSKRPTKPQSNKLKLQWKSSKSVVIGLAAGYGLDVYKSFAGSLRATGYDGSIILGIAPNPPSDVVSYLEKHNVKTYPVEIGECTYKGYPQNNGIPSKDQKCAIKYPDYKIQWSRFLMAKDWLLECEECTDGVMLTDTRDAYFQSDPFAYFDLPDVQLEPKPIMVFEEIFPNTTANHWLTEGPVTKCRSTRILKNNSLPMICSGSTMGSREGIIQYINAMRDEFDYWKVHDHCRSDMVGDDQAIHDYLFYKDKFGYGSNSDDVVAVKHRTGPIHVVGFQADIIFRRAIKDLEFSEYGKQHDLTIENMKAEKFVNQHGYRPVPNNNEPDNVSYPWQDWLGQSSTPGDNYFVDPQTGYILNNNGIPSPQIHQFDRFGLYFHRVYLNRLGNEKKW